MDRQQLIQLAEKISAGLASEEELALFNRYCNQFEAVENIEAPDEKTAGEQVLYTIRSQSSPRVVRKTAAWKRWSAAAALLALVATTIYFSREEVPEAVAPVAIQQAPADALPAADKATLTLADGTVIVLDSANSQQLAALNNVKVVNENGVLTYQYQKPSDSILLPAAVPENIIATPRGGKYRVVLPDGSRVWLNASSSLRFPMYFFPNQDRKVEVTGEAYFEVAKQSTPFKVKAKDYEVEVLGTHFNMNMYEDEPYTATTLLEGSIRLNLKRSSLDMEPGYQARTGKNNWTERVLHRNLEEVIAWKNGLFVFDKADFEDIMRQIARWYDVDVQFEGGVPENKFTAELSRETKLSVLLEILAESGINFSLEGKTLRVVKN